MELPICVAKEVSEMLPADDRNSMGHMEHWVAGNKVKV
jgi:hypothetical protein